MHANVYGTPLVPVSLVNIREEKKKPSPPQQPTTNVDVYSRIKVVIRARPAFENELEDTDVDSIVATVSAAHKITVLDPKKLFSKSFTFDRVFDPKTTQEDIYRAIGRPVVQDVLNGVNGTIMAYGQTGTGKTYTMGILGSFEDEHMGLVPRCLTEVFRHVEKFRDSHEVTWTCKLSFVQIYMEMIQDLLNPTSGNLIVRETVKDGTVIPDMEQALVRSEEEAHHLVVRGLKNRRMAPTLMNTTSSRAHTVLCLEVIKQQGHVITSAKLRLIDLAGSERVNRTQSTGSRLSEAKRINKSLSVLGNVIAGLARKCETTKQIERDAIHIPYRDSKLTRMLKDVLLGNSNICIVATVSPAKLSYYETLSTLTFAQRCMKVETHAHVNEKTDTIDYKALAQELQAQLSAIQGQSDLAAKSPMKDFMKHHHEDTVQKGTKDEDIEVAWGLVGAVHDTLWEVHEVSEYSVHSAAERVSSIESTHRKVVDQDAEDDIVESAVEEVQGKFPLKMINYKKRDAPLQRRALSECDNLEDFVQGVVSLHREIVGQLLCISKNLEVRDHQIEEMKRELVNHAVDKVERELEYQEWAKLLNSLMKQNEDLQNQVENGKSIINNRQEVQSTSDTASTTTPEGVMYSIDMAVMISRSAEIIQRAWREYQYNKQRMIQLRRSYSPNRRASPLRQAPKPVSPRAFRQDSYDDERESKRNSAPQYYARELSPQADKRKSIAFEPMYESKPNFETKPHFLDHRSSSMPSMVKKTVIVDDSDEDTYDSEEEEKAPRSQLDKFFLQQNKFTRK